MARPRLAAPFARHALLASGLLAACACAHGGASRGAEATAQVRAAVEAANAEFARALKGGDARAMAAVFTEDGEVIPAMQRGVVSGRAAIEAYHAARLEGRRYLDVVITTHHLETSGDLAWERGASRVTVQQGQTAPVTIHGRYLAVWRRDADGRWRLRADLPLADPVGP